MTTKEVHILYDSKDKTRDGTFYAYDNIFDAIRKQEELTKKYGTVTMTLPSGWRDKTTELPPINIHTKKLKSYYGTVWIAFKKDGNRTRFMINGKWGNIKYLKNKGWKFKKIILQEYKKPDTECPKCGCKCFILTSRWYCGDCGEEIDYYGGIK